MRRTHHTRGHEHEPEPPRSVLWLSVTYQALPRPLKFLVWASMLGLLHAAGLLPSMLHLLLGLTQWQ